MSTPKDSPKILFLDIETLPLEAFVWGLFDQNPGLSMMKTDWTLLSWSAKWRGQKKVYYSDVRNKKDLRDDKECAKGIWKLLDEADIVIGQNSDSFDIKKLNARFILNGLKPPSPYRTDDTKKIAKRIFGFTSNSLEYMSENMNKKYKKLKHKRFPGFEMWRECLKRNLAAFKEMERYNKHDVLATEELWERLTSWDKKAINLNVYSPDRITNQCNCGSSNLKRQGFAWTASGKFQRYRCVDCGKYTQDSGQANNALTPQKRSGLKRVQT